MKSERLDGTILIAGPGVQSDAASSGTGAEIFPEEDRFAKVYDHGRAQVVWTRLIADLETPVSAYLKLGDRRPMSFLLESIEGRLGARPIFRDRLCAGLVWKAGGETADLNRTRWPIRCFRRDDAPTLQSLRNFGRKRHRASRSAAADGRRISATWATTPCGSSRSLPEMTPDALGVPDAILIRPTLMLIFDNVKDEMILVTPVRPSAGIEAEDAYAAALSRIRRRRCKASMRRCRMDRRRHPTR